MVNIQPPATPDGIEMALAAAEPQVQKDGSIRLAFDIPISGKGAHELAFELEESAGHDDVSANDMQAIIDGLCVRYADWLTASIRSDSRYDHLDKSGVIEQKINLPERSVSLTFPPEDAAAIRNLYVSAAHEVSTYYTMVAMHTDQLERQPDVHALPERPGEDVGGGRDAVEWDHDAGLRQQWEKVWENRGNAVHSLAESIHEQATRIQERIRAISATAS